ncbi:MAG: hypothetical protein AAB736_00820 [Patescibacteria group bacterium]
MVTFFSFVMIGVVISHIIARRWEKSGFISGNGKGRVIDKGIVILFGIVIAVALGTGLSFLGGSFLKKEVVAEKYFILPMIFDGKPTMALVEDSSSWVLQIKEGNKTKLIKHNLHEKDIFFGDEEERYLKIKRSKTCRGNMWIWFFYKGTRIIESKAVFKKEDRFLTLPRYYSL